MNDDLQHIKDTIHQAKNLEKRIHEFDTYDTELAFLKTEARINRVSRWTLLSRTFSRIAAILLLPLIMSSAYFFYLYTDLVNGDERVAWYEVTSAPGLVTVLDLPDQSKVWLNAGSTLRYPARFNKKERVVKLQGEGYFEVESDKKHPFYVALSDDVKVMAHGTTFNVDAYADDETIETVLGKGAVDFFVKSRRVEMQPGQMLSYNKEDNKVTIMPVNTEDRFAWIDGRLIFRNTPLNEVLKQLSRRYNIDFDIQADSGKNYNCRATFTNETISQILDYLKLAAPIEWQLTEPLQKDDTTFPRQRIVVNIR